MSTAHRGVDMVVAGERDTKTPVELMSPVRRSRLGKGLLISCVAHGLLIGLTSFGLYADWMRFGIKMPQELKTIKKQIALAEMDAEREAARQKNAKASEPDRRSDEDAVKSAPSRRIDDVPGVVREASAVRDDRPTASRINLDEELGLD